MHYLSMCVCVCICLKLLETVLSLEKKKEREKSSSACDVLAEVLLKGSKDAFAFGIMYVQSGGK